MRRLIVPILLLCFSCGPDMREPVKELDPEVMVPDIDASSDYCWEFGWYGDGLCDVYCLHKDPDCEEEDQTPTCADRCEKRAPNGCFTQEACVALCQDQSRNSVEEIDFDECVALPICYRTFDSCMRGLADERFCDACVENQDTSYPCKGCLEDRARRL